MRILACVLFAACFLPALAGADVDQTSPVGTWQTFDDDTHAPRALVEIAEHEGELSGRIVKLFREPQEEPNPLCKDCPGTRHNQPVLGMSILWGMHRRGDAWDGGEILDPEEGRIYRATLRLEPTGKLDVRGYIGVSLLGRTQVWERTPP